MKRIALKTLSYGNIDDLKRDALYFDAIYFDVRSTRETTGLTRGVLKALSAARDVADVWVENMFSPKDATVDFLIDREILVPYDSFSVFEGATIEKGDDDKDGRSQIKIKFKYPPTDPIDEEWLHLFAPLFASELDERIRCDSSTPRVLYLGDDPVRALSEELERIDDRSDRRLKLAALLQRWSGGNDVFIPILSPSALLAEPVIRKQQEIASVVLSKFPVPADDTPWEQIIEFRSDPENQLSRLALRRWISQLASSPKSKGETEEELQYLLHQYTRLMELHKMKYERDILEIIVVTGLEVLENIVRLNWSKAAKTIFDLKRRRVDFLLQQQNIPGQEVAYVAKARSVFSGS